MRSINSRELLLPEFAVEAGVVGNQGGITDKLSNFSHHPLRRGCSANHHGPNAGERGNESRHANAGVHQALPGIDNLAILQQDGGHFQGSAAMIWHEAVGFKINDGVARHAITA